MKAPKDYFYDALFKRAEDDQRHPVRDYFEALKWDGVPRLNTWLTAYAGAERSPYTEAIGQIVLVASVRRIRKPGAKFDNLLVLEGKQGARKSSLVRVLAGDDWLQDNLEVGADAKEIIELTKGKLIVEFSELSGMNNRDLERCKSMLSRQCDSARMAYGRTTRNVPRQWIGVGTTNSDTYLRDPTGNRRYWPVRVGNIDLEALIRDRDQLWAEAVVLEAKGMSLDLPEALWPDAEQQQQQRTLSDPLEDRWTELVGGRSGIIPREELFAAVGLGAERASQRKSYQTAVMHRTMKKLGWEPARRRSGPSPHVSLDNYRERRRDNRKWVFVREIGAEEDAIWWKYDEDGECLVKD